MKKAFLSLLLVLSACSNNLETISTELSNISNVSTNTTENLAKLDNIIDFSTNTKNTYLNASPKLYLNGEAFTAVEKMLLSAKKSIYVEIYEIADDKAGNRISDILVKKAKEGLDVRFVYDAITNKDKTLMEYMEYHGVKVEAYGKNIIDSKLSVTHRKLYLVDGTKAMTGGMNIVEPFITGKVKDLLVGFEGEIAKQLTKEFYNDWLLAGGEDEKKIKETLKTALPSNIVDKNPMRLVITNPLSKPKKNEIFKMFISVIDSAKDNIKMAMPYFTDDVLIEHLIKAQKRGVKLTIIIPNKSYYKPVEMANTLTTNQLLKAGIDVYQGGKDGTYNHSKVMTVDNVWSTIGSCNADYRAFNSNQELNVAISDQNFTEMVNAQFFDNTVKESQKAKVQEIPLSKKVLYGLVEKLDNFL